MEAQFSFVCETPSGKVHISPPVIAEIMNLVMRDPQNAHYIRRVVTNQLLQHPELPQAAIIDLSNIFRSEAAQFEKDKPRELPTPQPLMPSPYPRLWESAGAFLPTTMKDRVWKPSIEEEKRAFYHERRTTKWRSVLKLMFFWRLFTMLVDCYRLALFDVFHSLFVSAVPNSVKRWWFNR